MTEPASNSIFSQSLAELLAAGPAWTLKERLVLARSLALSVQALHHRGRTHRALDAATLTVDERLQPQLGPPAGPRRFGAEQSDPEFCPPELASEMAIELPAEIDAATAILRQCGLAINPRRVDIYQFGVVLCQLLTGESLLSYRYSTSAKAKAPPMTRNVLDRCLGEDATRPLADCEGLIEALDELLRQCEDETPSALRETPPRGSGVAILAETPPQGSAVADPAKGSVIEELPFEQLGHFRVLERIGRGGMGDVYKGYDQSLDRYVAIKVLPAELARDKDFVRRFHVEAAAIAKLAHPNVVPIHFIGQDAGHHFFAMQFIDGESLGQQFARQRRLPLIQVVAIVEQCLAGLGAAHALGLVHRDIKPANILLDPHSGHSVLVDFGLVRQIGADAQMTASGVVMGTVDYIAPEQARGQQVDGRADIYSLGVMFYQLLAGRLPFKADSPTAMIFQHAYERPFPLKEAAPDLPLPVLEIVARMMDKDPDERYGSCAAVLSDLRAYREGRPLEAATASGISAPARGPIGQPTTDKPGNVDTDRVGVRQISPFLSLPSDTPFQRAKDWAATMFRRHAPEALQEFQGTTQQADRAVAEHARRSKRLKGLLDEARGVVAALAAQIGTTEQAAQDLDARALEAANSEAVRDKLRTCREDLATLQTQHDEQLAQVVQLEADVVKAEATLARLRSQRDLLNARMKAVEARQRIEGISSSRRNRFRWDRKMVLAVAGIAAVILGAVLILLRDKPRIPPQPPDSIGQAAVISLDATKLKELDATPPPPAAKQHQARWARFLGEPVIQTNSIGMKLVLIPPGEFQMGSPKELIDEDLRLHGGETWYRDRLQSEGPPHPVRITKPYRLGATDVTQEEYQRVMGSNPSKFQGVPKRPVERVTWDDAVEFCRRLSELPGEKAAKRRYELPTEAQWEYACRAGSSTRYCFGDDESVLGDYAWFNTNAGGGAHSVGQKRGNAWGLYDMHGNVWQWCQDWYDKDYYTKSPVDDPKGPASGSLRVYRGGGWNRDAGDCRSAARDGNSPEARGARLGFRVARVPVN